MASNFNYGIKSQRYSSPASEKAPSAKGNPFGSTSSALRKGNGGSTKRRKVTRPTHPR